MSWAVSFLIDFSVTSPWVGGCVSQQNSRKPYVRRATLGDGTSLLPISRRLDGNGKRSLVEAKPVWAPWGCCSLSRVYFLIRDVAAGEWSMTPLECAFCACWWKCSPADSGSVDEWYCLVLSNHCWRFVSVPTLSGKWVLKSLPN